MSERLLIGEESIAKKIEEIAYQLNQEFSGEQVVLVTILKGAFVFAADLIRHLDFPCTIEFIRAASYGMRGRERGELTIDGIDTLELKGKCVLLIDDIFDSGATLSEVKAVLAKQEPARIDTLVLLKKRGTAPKALDPTYVCFDIDDLFVVGYGLDYKEQKRGLKGIYTIE